MGQNNQGLFEPATKSLWSIILLTFTAFLFVSCNNSDKVGQEKFFKKDSLLYSTLIENPDILKAIEIEDSLIQLANYKSKLRLTKAMTDEFSTLELYDVKVCGGCWPIYIIYFSGCGFEYSFPYIDNWYYSKISDETELNSKLKFEKSLNKLYNGIKPNCSNYEIERPEVIIQDIINRIMLGLLDAELLYGKDTTYITDYYNKLYTDKKVDSICLENMNAELSQLKGILINQNGSIYENNAIVARDNNLIYVFEIKDSVTINTFFKRCYFEMRW